MKMKMLRSDWEFSWKLEVREERGEPSHSLWSAGGDLRFNVPPLTCSAATNIIRCHTSVCSDKRLTSLVSIQVKDTRELSNRNFSYKFWLFSVLIRPITPHSHSTLSFYCYCSYVAHHFPGLTKPAGMPPIEQKFRGKTELWSKSIKTSWEMCWAV